MSKPAGVEFTIDDVVEHMRQYMTKHRIDDLNSESRYFVKNAGMEFVVDRIGLNPQEVEILKRALSERICLEEALANLLIPTRYLYKALLGLPDDAKSTEIVGLHLSLGRSIVSLDQKIDIVPGPFKLVGEGPYTLVRQEMIKLAVQAAFAYTSKSILGVLDTEEKTRRFNYGAGAIVPYLDRNPATMGPSRN